MSSLKVDMKKPNNRAALNTTINKEVFEEFKRSCKISGVPMSTLIETFMRQYNEGGFYLKFGRDMKQTNLEFADEDGTDYDGVKDNFGEIVE